MFVLVLLKLVKKSIVSMVEKFCIDGSDPPTILSIQKNNIYLKMTYLFFGSNFPLIEFPGRHLNVFVNLCYIFNFHNWCRLNTRAYLRSSIYSLVLNNQVKNNSLLHIILKCITYSLTLILFQFCRIAL